VVSFARSEHWGVAVIPAKAGIHAANLWRCAVYRLDSRPSASSGQAFRGNDRCFEMDPTPNDTTTQFQFSASWRWRVPGVCGEATVPPRWR
jgi:hypothetical protein